MRQDEELSCMSMNDEYAPSRDENTTVDLAHSVPQLIHGSFTLTRQIAASPEMVFRAYADLPMRRRWFRLPGNDGGEHQLDFRVDGGERLSGTVAAAGVPERVEYRSHFLDIVPPHRLIVACTLSVDGLRRAVSLITIVLSAEGAGTRLTHTEHYTLLAVSGDGMNEIAEREGGTRLQLTALARAVTHGESGADEPDRRG